MSNPPEAEIFLVSAPGLEGGLCDEARGLGFAGAKVVAGGVTIRGGWPEVMRGNLELRGANRVLWRVAAFPAVHLSQLDRRARRVDWGAFLRGDVAVRVEASCRKSKIYHSGAAAERVAKAIHAATGASVSAEAGVRVLVRIESNLVTLSLDTSGAGLHKRGHKLEVNKAPLRETLAALFLRQCGFDGREALVDPMCGSGTSVIEAAEMALGLRPGRSRRFAFESMAGFDAGMWAAMQAPGAVADVMGTGGRFYGSDRDEGAVRMAAANAARAGVDGVTSFQQCTVSDAGPPDGAPGLVMVNPPYGGRMGDKGALVPLYRALGQTLLTRFGGWRVGLVTAEQGLAKATGLRFETVSAPVDNGGIRVRLHMTRAL